MTFCSFSRLLLVSLLITYSSALYSLTEDYTGAAFFEGFDWFTEADPTRGHVRFVNKQEANQTSMAGLVSGGLANSAVYMGLDTINQAPEGRPSVRVSSSKSFDHGLFIADIVHMPGGICGTWPAYWLLGPDWPRGGEIDIFEGVNDQKSNKMVLHTGPGVSIEDIDNSTFTGQVLTSDCDVDAPNQDKNAGCGITDGEDDETSYGTGFNTNGGGIFATEVSCDHIKIWFFPRHTPVPIDITTGRNPLPNEKTWGLPRATFRGNFSVAENFRQMKIIFDTTFCGDWAGAVWADNPTCSALAPTCEQYVSENPEAFAEAYWAVNSLRVYESDGRSAVEGGKISGDQINDEPVSSQKVSPPPQAKGEAETATQVTTDSSSSSSSSPPQPASRFRRSSSSSSLFFRNGGGAVVLPPIPRI